LSKKNSRLSITDNNTSKKDTLSIKAPVEFSSERNKKEEIITRNKHEELKKLKCQRSKAMVKISSRTIVKQELTTKILHADNKLLKKNDAKISAHRQHEESIPDTSAKVVLPSHNNRVTQ